MRERTPLEEALDKQFFVDRMLVLLEGEEGFRQILLTHEQFRKVGDAVIYKDLGTDKDKMQHVEFRMNLDTVLPKHLFEDMVDYDD